MQSALPQDPPDDAFVAAGAASPGGGCLTDAGSSRPSPYRAGNASAYVLPSQPLHSPISPPAGTALFDPRRRPGADGRHRSAAPVTESSRLPGPVAKPPRHSAPPVAPPHPAPPPAKSPGTPAARAARAARATPPAAKPPAAKPSRPTPPAAKPSRPTPPARPASQPERSELPRRALVTGTLITAVLGSAGLGAAWRAALFHGEGVTPLGTAGDRTGLAGGLHRTGTPGTVGGALAGSAPKAAALDTAATANTGISAMTGPLAFEIDPMTGLRAPQAAGAGHRMGVAARHPAVPQPAPVAATVTPELLLSRVTYGATPALRAEIKQVGIPAWLGRQLAPGSLPDPEGDAVAAMYPTLARTPQSLWVEYEDDAESRTDAPRDLQAAHLGRAIWSRRQLFEVMTGLWADHFHVPVDVGNARLTRADYDRTVLREHALGRFEDLLVAVAHHPAMLSYLNLAGSAGSNPNESFARELLELHTAGDGFTESDVKQAAKLMTGLVLTPDMTVTYEPSRHYVGAVKIMEFRHANADAATGPAAVRAFLSYLAHHPGTARSVAMRLARRLVSDNPSPNLVQTLADVYLASGTQIVPVLRALFASPEFGASTGAKLRRPMEHAVAVARVTGLKPGSDSQSLIDLVWWLNGTGHVPFTWSTPGGFPDTAADWQSPGQALTQFKVANALIHGWGPRAFSSLDPAALLCDPAKPSTAADVATALTLRLFDRAPSATEFAAVTSLLSAKAFEDLPAHSAAQREATASAAVLLVHSPAFLTR